jgi:hypothetical protein
LARLIVDEGWPVARAAERYDVSWPTAKRWATRYAELGPAGMADRSSRPHHSPTRTPQPVVRAIVHLRLKQRLGPVQIAGRLAMAASTVHAVLVRCRVNRLCHLDRVTGEPVRRYEHPYPGAMLHVDVKKYGNIPDGGGWRYVGRVQGDRNREKTARRTGSRNRRYEPRMGTAFVHTVIDDHSRIAYAEIRDDETAATAIDVLQNAVAWFTDRGVTVGQRLGLQIPRLGQRLRRTRHSTAQDPPLPPTNQRKSRTVPPDHERRLGPGPPLQLRESPPQSPTRLAPSLQSPPASHRNRRPATHHQVDQRPWPVQLGRSDQPAITAHRTATAADRGAATGARRHTVSRPGTGITVTF